MLTRTYVPGPPYCTYGLHVPEAQGSLSRVGTTVRTLYTYQPPAYRRGTKVRSAKPKPEPEPVPEPEPKPKPKPKPEPEPEPGPEPSVL